MLEVQTLSNFIKWPNWVQRYMQNKEKKLEAQRKLVLVRLVNKIYSLVQSFTVRKRVKPEDLVKWVKNKYFSCIKSQIWVQIFSVICINTAILKYYLDLLGLRSRQDILIVIIKTLNSIYRHMCGHDKL